MTPMDLLAQTTDANAWWLSLTNYGVLGIIVLAGGFATWRILTFLGDKLFNNDVGVVTVWAKGQAKLQETLSAAIPVQTANTSKLIELNEKQAATLETLSRNVETKLDTRGDLKYANHIFSNVNTNRAIAHLAEAAKELCDNPTAERYIDSAMRAARGEG